MNQKINLAAIKANFGDINTIQTESTRFAKSDIALESAEHPEVLSRLIETTLNDIAAQINVSSQLIKIKNLMHFDLPVTQRPKIFRQLNLLLGALCYYQQDNRENYGLTQSIMTHMHHQLDAQPQPDSALAEEEWNELQKAVYLLTDWETQTENVNPSYATITSNPR